TLAAYAVSAATGDVDPSFDAGSGMNGGFENAFDQAMVVQPDGKIVIGGRFTTVKGLVRRGIARLSADGSGDISFNPRLTPSSRAGVPDPAVISVALQ